MDEILNTEKNAAMPETVPEIYLGTAGSSSASGVEITLDGQSDPMQKEYKMLLTGRTPTSGARVMCVKISGTYVVLGEIGNPSS